MTTDLRALASEMLAPTPDCALDADHPASRDDHWALGPVIETRYSTLVEQSNARALESALDAQPALEGQWHICRLRHWACGWVEHLSMRVLDDRGEPSAMLAFWARWAEALEDYPVADDDALSEAEYEAAIEAIERDGRRLVADDAPEDWPACVFLWLSANDPSELDDADGHGASPSDHSIRMALSALGMLDTQDAEEESEQ